MRTLARALMEIPAAVLVASPAELLFVAAAVAATMYMVA